MAVLTTVPHGPQSAASLTMFASSAPEAPEAIRAILLKSTSGSRRDLPGMNLQDLFTALEVRQFYRHTAVEPAGTQQRRVQSLRTVGGSQNDDAGIVLEAVHFGEQLVEGLFPLVVAAELSVTLFADGVDLIDKDDAGSFLAWPA